LDEVVDIEAIAYEHKIQLVVKRTTRKRNITLDNTMFITTEETLLDSEKYKVSKILGEGVAISQSTIDRAKEDEMEVHSMRRYLERLRHQVEYYSNANQEVILLRVEFLEEYEGTR
jgi:hypothetical protein